MGQRLLSFGMSVSLWLCVVFGTSSFALAVPIPLSGLVFATGNRLDVGWVDLDDSADSLAETLSVLALRAGGPGDVGETTGIVSYLDQRDSCGGSGCQGFVPGLLSDPFSLDENLLVRSSEGMGILIASPEPRSVTLIGTTLIAFVAWQYRSRRRR